MARDTEAERIWNEPYEPTEADLTHQARIEADPRWPHEGGPPIGTISEDAPIAKLVRHHEAKRAAAEAETGNQTAATPEPARGSETDDRRTEPGSNRRPGGAHALESRRRALASRRAAVRHRRVAVHGDERVADDGRRKHPRRPRMADRPLAVCGSPPLFPLAPRAAHRPASAAREVGSHPGWGVPNVSQGSQR